jgi:ribosomal protein S18 acetylase RimI-like enzyme
MPNPTPIAVTPATPADVDSIVAIITEARDWLHARGIRQWAEPLPPGWVAGCVERGEFQIARQQGQIVGMFRLIWIDKGRLWGDSAEAGYLGKLAVARSAAGRGLGLELLAAAERMVTGAGRKLLRLDCWAGNAVLISYYERAGFRRCGTGRCMDFEMALMEKESGSCPAGRF